MEKNVKKKNVYIYKYRTKKKKRTETLIVSINQYIGTSNYYNELLRACCSSTGKWYLRWDLRSVLSSSSSSCCHIRSYPWHSSRGIVADADGAPAWPPHNTAPAPPGLASATACHTPKIQIHRFIASLYLSVHHVPVLSPNPPSPSPLSLSLALAHSFVRSLSRSLSVRSLEFTVIAISGDTSYDSPRVNPTKTTLRPFPRSLRFSITRRESEISLDPTYNALYSY